MRQNGHLEEKSKVLAIIADAVDRCLPFRLAGSDQADGIKVPGDIGERTHMLLASVCDKVRSGTPIADAVSDLLGPSEAPFLTDIANSGAGGNTHVARALRACVVSLALPSSGDTRAAFMALAGHNPAAVEA